MIHFSLEDKIKALESVGYTVEKKEVKKEAKEEEKEEEPSEVDL